MNRNNGYPYIPLYIPDLLKRGPLHTQFYRLLYPFSVGSPLTRNAVILRWHPIVAYFYTVRREIEIYIY